MAWRVACSCGQVFDCEPPALCPGCGHLVQDPADRDWLDRIHDEIGNTTTPPEGGAW